VTASLWRRLTDLPPRYGAALGWDDALTTEAVVLPARPLGEALAHVAKARDERVAVMLISAVQAASLQSDPPCARLLRAIDAASAGPTRQRVLDLSRRPLPPGSEGEPTAVLLIRGGKVAADVSQRSRSRRSYRYTLDTDVVEWVRAQAERREVSASEVVQDALVEAARGRLAST
jgi:hypothetical protein